jgi:hypothetical protein
MWQDSVRAELEMLRTNQSLPIFEGDSELDFGKGYQVNQSELSFEKALQN